MNKFTQNVRANKKKKQIDNSNRGKHKHFARFLYTTKPYSFFFYIFGISNKVICAFSYEKEETKNTRIRTPYIVNMRPFPV